MAGVQKYVLGFNVVDFRSLQFDDGVVQADVYFKIHCCGKTFESIVKEGAAPNFLTWDVKQLWADIELLPEEFESAYVEIAVFTRNWFTRDYLVGKSSLQLSSINGRQNHVYSKKPIPLIREDQAEATGVVTLTIYCLKPNEPPPNEQQQEEEKDDQDNDDLAKAICGATVETGEGRPHMIYISIFKVEKLPLDGFSLPTPFVTVEFGGHIVKTESFPGVVAASINAEISIPVMTPVYEDTIHIKLWNKRMLGADELMAQGLFSFSSLRNKPLLPRWFCFYGFNAEEIPLDAVKDIAKQGEAIEPNHFKGMLLIGGRVQCLDSKDEMGPPTLKPTRTSGEPMTVQRTLLVDIFEVTGAVNRECMVELSVANQTKQSQWEVATWEDEDEGDDDDDDAKERTEVKEQLTTFKFTQESGRIEAMSPMFPDKRESRPKVMINIYTRGVLSAKQRVGWCKVDLQDITRYESGTPARPKFYSLTCMPFNGEQKTALSVLMTLEQTTTENVNRHNRKHMMPLLYCLRTYCFMARDILDSEKPQSYHMRITCAGSSKSSVAKKEVRPMWMKPVDMKITLWTDHKDEPPTMEPIIVAICKGEFDLGKAQCSYKYMRRKDTMGLYEQYILRPQWIELYGGSFGTVKTAEALLAFELILWSSLQNAKKKHAQNLASGKRRDGDDDDYVALSPKQMWPEKQETYNDDLHYCKYRKATLHFSLLGLRDIVHARGMPGAELLGFKFIPEVTVQVKKFDALAADDSQKKYPKYYEMRFKYREFRAGGDIRSKEDKLHCWETGSLGNLANLNYEFMQSQMLNIRLPDALILEPFITVKVTLRQIREEGGWKVTEEQIGDHRRSLTTYFPCCWYTGDPNMFTELAPDGTIDPKGHYPSLEPVVEKFMKEGLKDVSAKKTYEEETAEERQERLMRDRDDDYKKRLKEGQAAVQKAPEILTVTSADGLPPEFQPWDPQTNPVGLKKDQRDMLSVCKDFTAKQWISLNCIQGTTFKERKGESIRKQTKGIGQAEQLPRGAEDEADCDFYFKASPLVQNMDVLDPEDDEKAARDWNFEYSACHGFVKFVFKLTDGWEGPIDILEFEAEQEAANPTKIEPQASEFLKSAEQWSQGIKDRFGWAKNFLEEAQQSGGDAQAMAEPKEVANEVAVEDLPESVEARVQMELKDGSDVSVVIFTAKAIDTMKLDALQTHVSDLVQDLRGSKSDPLQDTPPSHEKELRTWVKMIQRKHLEPLKETPTQQMLRLLANDIKEEQRLVLAKKAKPEDLKVYLDRLLNTVKKDTDVDFDSNPETQMRVSYADLNKVGIWHLIREIRAGHVAADVSVREKIDEIRLRFQSLEKLNTTFKFDQLRHLREYAFDDQKFFEHYRAVPNRLRCRIYYVKSICIFEKSYGSADPYIKYRIGDVETTLRAQAQTGTNEPEFYRVEERDIVFPQDCRLQVDLCDIGDVPLDGVVTKAGTFDSIIGSTVLDLEDRWFSPSMRNDTVKNKIPRENRRLYKISDAGKQSVTGSFVLWIEMIDAKEAADKKATQLQKPKPVEIELRIVIRTCQNVKLVDNGKVDVKVGVSLQCQEYFGHHPTLQKTDVHFGSTDGHAVFNWRIVYPKVTMPTKACILDLILYDYNLLGDTTIGTISLDIRKYFEKVASSMDTLQKDDNKLPFSSGLDEDEGQNIGEIRFDMTLLPQTEAASKPAGIAREEPNENPQLLTPKEGRDWDSVLPSLAFSLPSFGFYKKVLPLIFLTLLCLVGLKYVGLL